MTDQAGANSIEVPVSWDALEDAFENNAPDVHSYLSLADGGVRRVVDGVADPSMKRRLASDGKYLRVDPVSSREQYRWMERFIEGLDNTEARDRLAAAIDGKGAFRRFKDALMSYPEDRENWFAFRSQKLRVAIKAWLDAHDIEVVDRATWEAGRGGAEESADELSGGMDVAQSETRDAIGMVVDILRNLGEREVEMVQTFAEFLQDRKLRREVSRRRVVKATDTGRSSVDEPAVADTEQSALSESAE